MITNTGKSILGKYLLGQAPAYASYIAVGCGSQPLETGDIPGDYSNKQNLDFEMFRIPISSRGFVNEGGISKIVLTGELPTEERYEISEVGIYSAGVNPSAGLYDSKTLFGFASTDNWNRHTSSAVSEIPNISSALDESNDNIISTENAVFKTNADNSIFYKSSRANRYERCRFLNNIIAIKGNESTLTKTSGHFVVGTGSNHIHLAGVKIDLSQNSPVDEIRLAFSLISKDGSSVSVPDTVRILVDFASTDSGSGEYARFEAELFNGTDPGEYDFTTNRYFVISKQLQQLYTSANFTWDAVTVVKIYASTLSEKLIDQKSLTGNVATIRTVLDHGLSAGNVVTITGVDSTFNGEYTIVGTPTSKTFTYSKTYSGTIATTDVIPSGTVSLASPNYYVALDAMRLENIATVNPLYGLVGYSAIQNLSADTITKSPNTNNYIEFRFSVGVSDSFGVS
jgi:hypothetical protein